MASSQNRVAKLLLRIESEQQNIQRAKQQLASFESNFSKFKTEAERTNVALEKQAAVLLRQKIAAAQAEKATRDIGNTERRVKQDIEQTTRAIQQQSTAIEQQETAASGGSRLRALGRAARVNLPAVPIGGGFSSEQIARAVEGIGFADEALGRLGATGKLAAGAIGVAIVAITALLIDLKKRNDEAKASADAALASQGRYLELVATGTSESIEAALEQARIDQQIAQDRQAFTQAVLDGLDQAIDAGGAFNRITAEAGVAVNSILGTQPELVATRQANEANKTALIEAAAETYALERALNSAEVAANDAAAAEEALAKARQDAVDQSIQNTLQAQLQIASLDAEGTRKRLDALHLEQGLISRIVEQGEASQELSDKLAQRSSDINDEIQVLARALPEKERIEAAADAFERIKNGIANFVEETKRRFEEFQQAARRITELQEQFNLRLMDIERRRQQAIEDAGFTRDQDIVRARRDSAIVEAEAVRKAGLERAEIERETQRNIARIISRSRFDIENAIQDRDAVALDLARRRRDEEVRGEQDNRRERLRELDNGLKEELRTIRRRLNQQILTIDERYAEQVRRANLAAQRSIAVETEKFQRELAIRAAALRQVLGIEQRQQQAEVTIAARGAQANLTIQGNFWKNSIALAQRAVQSIGSQAARVQQFNRPSPTPRGGGFMPSMDTGGRILSDGLVFAHAGEMIVNPRRGQTSGVNINIEGLNRREIHRSIDRALDDYTLENF